MGCRGVKVRDYSSCLAHLMPEHRDAYLSSLRPGDSINHDGTRLEDDLLSSLLERFRDGAGEKRRIGAASFHEATFAGVANFRSTTFTGETTFSHARFEQPALFDWVTFEEEANFYETYFQQQATFIDVQFKARSEFEEASFPEGAWFAGCRFTRSANFMHSTFGGKAIFNLTEFQSDLLISHARFRDANFIGIIANTPLSLESFICAGELNLSQACFKAPVTVSAAVSQLRCVRTRWEATAALRLRRTSVDLTDSVLSQPLSITSLHAPLDDPYLQESGVDWLREDVAVESVSGVDCSFLSLMDVDLSKCRFAGALHLDQIRLEGYRRFSSPPRSRFWHLGLPLRWTPRQVIEEERQWRALPSRRRSQRAGWGSPPDTITAVPGLATLTAVYRQLRKAREDAKDEPGAADFYYGEMEMRRHSFRWRKSERWLLQLYWLISGYGLRASRAIGWLLATMLITIILLMGFGVPASQPKETAVGNFPSGDGKVNLVIDKQDPALPEGNRFTSERFEKSLKITLNSVIFRSSEQDLTTAGGYIEMASRFLEPILLGLAALATRGRLKR
ncbi:pentapeptide repeat-containing protein [Streptomyces sp. H28]|nr:pentapeptide repeat-containing protein [Streptomyces sp. H28]